MTTTAAAIWTRTSWSTWKATRASPPATPRAGRWVRPRCPDDALYGHFPLDPRRHRRHSAARDRRRVRQARVHESLRHDQIGRASCRARVCQYVWTAVEAGECTTKKKKQTKI